MNRTRDSVALFVLFIVLAGVYGVASSAIQKRKPATPVTFGNIASHEKGDKVAIEGLITFSSSVSCNSSGVCTLYLVPASGSPVPGLRVVLWIRATTPSQAESNSFYLPMMFGDKSDLRLYTDDGRELTIEDRVRITGKVHKIGLEENETAVYVVVEKVE